MMIEKVWIFSSQLNSDFLKHKNMTVVMSVDIETPAGFMLGFKLF